MISDSQLIDDWKSFCEGNLRFDKSYFLPLFHEEYNDAQLRSIVGCFESNDSLFASLKRFYNAKQKRASNFCDMTANEALDLAMEDLKGKSIALKAFKEFELESIILNAMPKVISNHDEFENIRMKSWPNGELHVLLTDYFDSKRVDVDDISDALFEAFYGVANSYQIQWAIGASMINTQIDLTIYLDLWANRIEWALGEKELLVYIPQ